MPSSYSVETLSEIKATYDNMSQTNPFTNVNKFGIVVILCFVNLINYMDRYSVAGK